MSYPNISMNSVLNCIYAESEGRPFKEARYFADRLYWFAREHGCIKPYEIYTNFVLGVLNALTGNGDISPKCQTALNKYFENQSIGKDSVVPPAYISAIKSGTKRLEAKHNAALDKIVNKPRRIPLLNIPQMSDEAFNRLAQKQKRVNATNGMEASK